MIQHRTIRTATYQTGTKREKDCALLVSALDRVAHVVVQRCPFWWHTIVPVDCQILDRALFGGEISLCWPANGGQRLANTRIWQVGNAAAAAPAQCVLECIVECGKHAFGRGLRHASACGI